MNLNRHLGQGLRNRCDKLPRRAGRQNASHVLDGQRVNAHVGLLLRKLHVKLGRVHGRRRVANRTLRMPAVLLHAANRRLKVARIVQRIEDAENVHSVLAGQRDKAFDDVVRIVLVAENVLTAQQHLKRRLLADLANLAQTLPGVLAQEAHADVKGRPAPAFQGVEARIVHLLGDAENVVRPHTRRPQGLVRIAQGCIRNPNQMFVCFFHIVSTSTVRANYHPNAHIIP